MPRGPGLQAFRQGGSGPGAGPGRLDTGPGRLTLEDAQELAGRFHDLSSGEQDRVRAEVAERVSSLARDRRIAEAEEWRRVYNVMHDRTHNKFMRGLEERARGVQRGYATTPRAAAGQGSGSAGEDEIAFGRGD